MSAKSRNQGLSSSRSMLQLDEAEQQLRQDYEWVLHDTAIQRQQAGKVVAVHKKRIWGVGESHSAALAEALKRPDCPSRQELALVYVEGRAID
jgi:hypothetical protein